MRPGRTIALDQVTKADRRGGCHAIHAFSARASVRRAEPWPRCRRGWAPPRDQACRPGARASVRPRYALDIHARSRRAWATSPGIQIARDWLMPAAELTQ